MKATTLIIAAALTLQVNFLFAGNDIVSAPVSNESNISLASLAPVTPGEATFEEDAMPGIDDLAPVTPVEAGFEEMSAEVVSSLGLAPSTPSAAGFSDASEEMNITSLAPVTPSEADFQ